jgi:hypothetical protein
MASSIGVVVFQCICPKCNLRPRTICHLHLRIIPRPAPVLHRPREPATMRGLTLSAWPSIFIKSTPRLRPRASLYPTMRLPGQYQNAAPDTVGSVPRAGASGRQRRRQEWGGRLASTPEALKPCPESLKTTLAAIFPFKVRLCRFLLSRPTG